MKKYTAVLFLCFIFIFFPVICGYSQIPQLWVDRTELYADDVLNVYIKLTGSLKKTAVDISPYYSHFDVISFNKMADNQKYDYLVKLVPKRFGMTMLPPLNIDGHKTSRIMIRRYEQSLKKSANGLSQSPDLFVKVKVLDYNMYMYGKGKIQLCLYDGIGIIDGKVDDPRVKGAYVRLITQNQDRVEEVNNRSYLVKSWDYEVSFDMPSLAYVVDPVRFKGTINGPIIEGKPNFYVANPFRGVSFAPPRDLTVYSERISLPVKSVPPHSFPAKKVFLDENYEAAADLKINDSVKRNITVYAVGGSMNVDTEINSREDANLYTVYPSQISKRMIKYRGEPALEIKRSFVYVFNKDGRIELPEISFIWFNIESGMREHERFLSRAYFVKDDPALSQGQASPTAYLPASPASSVSGMASMTVPLQSVPAQSVQNTSPLFQPSSGGGVTFVNNVSSQLAAATQAQQTATSQSIGSAGASSNDEGADTDIIKIFGVEFLEKTLYQIVIVFLLLCFLISSLLRGRKKKVKSEKTIRRKSKKEPKDMALTAFYNAARLGDAKTAEATLIKFADSVEPEQAPHNLVKVGILFGGNRALMAEIENLNRELYSENNDTWNGANLIVLIKKFYKIVELKMQAKQEKEAKKDETLPSLYMN